VKIYFLEIQIGSYFLQVVSDTPKNAMTAMKEQYENCLADNWKVTMPWRDYVEYAAVTPKELQLNHVAWN
jgi:hypothetical protein